MLNSLQIEKARSCHLLANDSSKRSNFLILDPFNNAPNLQIGLEIALRLSLQGQIVRYIHYGQSLPFVEWYQRNGCLKDRLLGYPPPPQERGVMLLNKISRQFRLGLRASSLSRIPWYDDTSCSLEDVTSLEQLVDLSYENSSALGLSTVSSLVSIFRDPYLNPSDHKTLCKNLIQSYIASYHIAIQNLKQMVNASLVICNGRFAATKGAVVAAEQLGLPVYFFERGSSPTRFSLTSFHPHDRIAVQHEIRRHWSIAPTTQRALIAHKYFHQRRNSINEDWISFTANQTKEHAASVIQEAKRISKTGKLITYFTSSDDEFLYVKDFYSQRGRQWLSQREALQKLIFEAHQCGHAVIVRVHPNLESCSQKEGEAWNTLSFIDNCAGVCIVPSYSLASSYDILDASDLVATYGSTMGIEAVHWGTPSLLLGDSLYDSIGASVLSVYSSEELYNYLSNPNLWIVQQSTADCYGYYMATFGFEHIMYQPSSLFSGSFLGNDLHHYTKTILHKFVDTVRRRSSEITE